MVQRGMAAIKGSFNPRSRTGNDPVGIYCKERIYQVSIHVPARGTTFTTPLNVRNHACFNPRSRTGNDGESGWSEIKSCSFNPRSRTGNDDHIKPALRDDKCFNPRSRTGNDGPSGFSILVYGSFQSTFPHGERRSRLVRHSAFVGVSIHVPARGTTISLHHLDDHIVSFNPRSRTGNDVHGKEWGSLSHTFQSTFPHGERRGIVTSSVAISGFQSTFPHGERPKIDLIHYSLTGFNPRSRTGNDDNTNSASRYPFVSIHVPARGTTLSIRFSSFACMFQSTFPHGERPTTLREFLQFKCFNPRSRTGNDKRASDKLASAEKVSIHVPARGTTPGSLLRCPPDRFQSTFPHGERREPVDSSPKSSRFNPRSRTGNDRPAPAPYQSGLRFNPRSRTGNDVAKAPYFSAGSSGFNPRSRTGNDLISGGSFPLSGLFQSTFPHGERRITRSGSITG